MNSVSGFLRFPDGRLEWVKTAAVEIQEASKKWESPRRKAGCWVRVMRLSGTVEPLSRYTVLVLVQQDGTHREFHWLDRPSQFRFEWIMPREPGPVPEGPAPVVTQADAERVGWALGAAMA